MLFSILTFFIGQSSLGDETVQKIGEKIDQIKEKPEIERRKKDQQKWEEEKAKIRSDHERIKAKWSSHN